MQTELSVKIVSFSLFQCNGTVQEEEKLNYSFDQTLYNKQTISTINEIRHEYKETVRFSECRIEYCEIIIKVQFKGPKMQDTRNEVIEPICILTIQRQRNPLCLSVMHFCRAR